jgi:hypothetical protein
MKTLTVSVLGTMMTLAFLAGFGFRGALAQQSSGGGQTTAKLPPDIRPETLTRMPQATRDEFTAEEDREAFDHLVAAEPRFAKPSKGAMGGTGTRLHIPVVADAYRIALNHLREKCGLDLKYQELAVLVASRESNNEYEWSAHEKLSAKVLPRDIVEIVRNKQDAKGLGEKEETIIRFGREMHRDIRVSSKTFADMERLFGRRGTLAIALIMGYYENNALLFRAYDQRLNPSDKRPFPDVVAMDVKNQ